MRSPSVAARGILTVLCIFLCGFFVYYPLTNTDIWWHMAAAREMLIRKSFLYHDPFTFTPSIPWINLHWIFQLFAYGLYGLGGERILVLAKSFLFASSCFILLRAVNVKQRAATAAIIMAVCAFEMRYLVLMRPIVLTLLFLATTVWCLERLRNEFRLRFCVAIIAIQIVWVNSQGLFYFGPFLVLAYLAGWGIERRIVRQWPRLTAARRETPSTKTAGVLMVVLVVMVCACCVNPYGIKALAFPFRLLGRIDPAGGNIFSRNISENTPFLALYSTAPRYCVTVVLMLIVSIALFLLNRNSVRFEHVLIFAAFTMLAFMAERNIVFFLFYSGYVTGYNLSIFPKHEYRHGITGNRFGYVIAITAGIVLAVSAATHAMVLRECPPRPYLSPFRVPAGAVEYLKKYPVEGNIFNSIRYGGYLLWHLYPGKQVFIDGRLVIRTPDFFGDYLAALDKPELFETVVRERAITHVLVPTAIFYRYMELSKFLYRDARWHVAYADGASVLFVRNDIGSTAPRVRLDSLSCVDEICANLARQWRERPRVRRESLMHLAVFLDMTGEFKSAEYVYSRCRE